MKLLVILIALFFEKYLNHKLADMRVSWVYKVQTMLLSFCNRYSFLQSQIIKSIITLLPIWLVAAGVYWIIYDQLWGIAAFVFNLIIFYLCIGPMNIFYPSEKEGVGLQHLVIANNAIFSPIFWYLLFGPLFILAYRLIDLACQHNKEQLHCESIVQWVNWIPARIAALCYLFVGHFQQGIESFGNNVFTWPNKNSILLEACAKSSFSDEQELLSELQAEKALENSMILYLVMIAIVIIVAWF